MLTSKSILLRFLNHVSNKAHSPVFINDMHLSNEDDEWTTVKPKERKIKKFNYDDIPEEESKKKEDENDYPVYDAEYDGY